MRKKILACFYLLAASVYSSLCFSAADSVSSKTYKELTEIQEVMGAGQVDDAYQRLQTLLGEVEEDTLDQALTLQTLGYVEMARENFPLAIKHLKKSLSLNRLPQNVVYNVGYMVAQLHAALGEFDEALIFAEDWFTRLEAPKPSQMIFMANIYAQTKQYDKSIPYAERAIAAVEEPKESWLQLLTANYFELKKFKGAAKTLEQMLDLWPEKAAYWEQLASVYVVLESEKNALATLKIAFSEGILEKESTVKSVVQLSVSRGIPEQAARLILKAMDQELLPKTEEYYKMLAVAYSAARERDSAISAYEKLSELTESGDAWISISNIYVEKGEWAKAETALQKALDKELEEPGKAWLLLGVAQTEQQKFQAGKKSLKKAKAYEKTERSASRWLKYADDMKRQADWVAQFK